MRYCRRLHDVCNLIDCIDPTEILVPNPNPFRAGSVASKSTPGGRQAPDPSRTLRLTKQPRICQTDLGSGLRLAKRPGSFVLTLQMITWSGLGKITTMQSRDIPRLQNHRHQNNKSNNLCPTFGESGGLTRKKTYRMRLMLIPLIQINLTLLNI